MGEGALGSPRRRPQHSAGRRSSWETRAWASVSLRWLLPGTCSPVPLDCELLEDEGFAFVLESAGPPLSLCCLPDLFQKALTSLPGLRE